MDEENEEAEAITALASNTTTARAATATTAPGAPPTTPGTVLEIEFSDDGGISDTDLADLEIPMVPPANVADIAKVYGLPVKEAGLHDG